MPSNDDDLLKRALDGDEEALDQLLKREYPVLKQRLAGKIPKRHQAVLSADDVIQETFAEAVDAIRRKQFAPRGEGSFAAWLRTIAQHNFVDAIKGLDTRVPKNRKRIVPGGSDESRNALLEQLHVTNSTPSRHARHNERLDHLEQAIEQLVGTHQRVIKMYDIEQRPMAEVAAEMGCSEGAAFMRRARALRHLREIMGRSSKYFSDSG
ncbi:MAG: sigma-70 family RNA polymerase sigma factor [Phycisphaerae bacterium]|nr:sigma-70 family RNA polymerase sigma factor [Phycisphaerae bacterium]